MSTLRVKKIGSDSYGLVDDDRGPISDVNRFLGSLDVRGLSPRTVRAYAFDLLIVHRWLDRTDRRLIDLRPHDMLDFIADQRRRNADPQTINRQLTTCRLLYRFVTNRELDGDDNALRPAGHYKGRGRDHDLGLHRLRSSRPRLRVKTARKVVEPLTASEVRTFLRSLRRYRDLAIVHLMLLAGLRSHEVLGVRICDVDFHQRRLRVRGKGNKERLLPLAQILIRSIQKYLSFERPARCGHDFLFTVLQGRQRGQRMTVEGLRSLFRDRRDRRGTPNANAHRFRHTFGADMARAGVRLPVLQKMMGHANGSTTLQYINLSMADVVEEYQRASEEIRKRYRT